MYVYMHVSICIILIHLNLTNEKTRRLKTFMYL